MSGGATFYDLFVIGGGVNGCGVARDAAGRGFSVGLAEKDDLASGTSSKSTKLVHGGLRYLETLEFGMVREALREREILLTIAPHLVRPMRFILPVAPGARPAWLLRLGLFLYDRLGVRQKLPGAKALDLRKAPEGAALRPDLRKAFSYWDGRVDDSRLVVLNARDAADRGADILTRAEVMRTRVEDGAWRIALRDRQTSAEREIAARLVVNAAGPWAESVLRGAIGARNPPRLRLVRGSHIVTRKLFDSDAAFLFQADDGRVVFAIPYQNDFTLIGTTDVDHSGAPEKAAITAEETAYLCRVASAFLARGVAPPDVLWSFSGVRPLNDDGGGTAAKVSRDYAIDETGIEGAPLISILGGKLTAFRHVAEQVVDRAAAHLGARGRAWTATPPLPGGDFSNGDLAAVEKDLAAKYPFLRAAEARRLAHAYGTLCDEILGAARRREDLGRNFGMGLSEAELDYLAGREWARTAEDVLWRRSKLGLHADAEKIAAIDAFLAGEEK
ncbi:glycerol-3-phosphate dehydrogenase [Rhodoblastus acidophilus]|uniref:Glycerol-3-phosphate dehydrogenase n=1 Tax=Candidatus Rhodoblastus alkanivorans TaxID=2954117 RepID=A0ABS9Z3M1_9HYPH|nr:glycerol-3-phosphate dehydrogenase [Candidatus Rhodoblastus alkanivorans]MCI4682271.1 glycerol-3-phosphate dehydrogenase [Candidatus Rhodoblastus alkanivorans]MDI4639573.1 glycerol-3-phosphate dehydrogenase [Rhodoblastus acidophilus]